MVTRDVKGDDLTVQMPGVAGGEELVRIQEALILAIETLGSDKDTAGSTQNRQAVFTLGQILRECLLDESQVNVGLGGKPYNYDMKASSK